MCRMAIVSPYLDYLAMPIPNRIYAQHLTSSSPLLFAFCSPAYALIELPQMLFYHTPISYSNVRNYFPYNDCKLYLQYV